MISRVRCRRRGAICPTLQGYTSIRTLALSGALPRAFIRLNLTDLILGGTQLCIPPDAGFQRWLQGIPNRRVPICLRSDGPQAYLTQATQSLTHPVPLVAGKPALLRVFVATDKNVDVSMPPVRATFYRNGTWVHTADIPRRETTVPRVVDEGSLSASANAEIPSFGCESGVGDGGRNRSRWHVGLPPWALVAAYLRRAGWLWM